MATQQIQGDGTLGPVTRPRNSDRFPRTNTSQSVAVGSGDPHGLIALLAWRALWYGGGCDGLEDLHGYQTEHPGGLMEDAGVDLAAALERIRTLDALVGAERAENDAHERGAARLKGEVVRLEGENATLAEKIAEAQTLVQLKIAELAQRLEEERALRDAIVRESAEKIQALDAVVDPIREALENERTVHAQTRGELERVRLRAQTAERELEAARAEHCPGCDDAECQRGADH